MAGPMLTDKVAYLLFPPSAPWQGMPEMGIHQLADVLNRHGVPARCLDLNILLHQEWLDRPDVQAAISSILFGEWARHGHRSPPQTAADWLALAGPGPEHADRVLELLWRRRRGRTPRHRALPDTHPAYDWDEAFRVQADSRIESLCRNLPWFRVLLAEAFHYYRWRPATTSADEVFEFALGRVPLLDDFYDEVLAEVSAQSPPLFFGVSLWTTDQIAPALRLVHRIREAWPKVPVIAGGAWCTSAMTLLPTVPDLFDFLDAVVVGHADKVIVPLAEAARECRSFQGLPNTVVRGSREVILPPVIEKVRLAEVTPPTFDQVRLDLYPDLRLPIRVNDGCPWGRCIYCHHVVPGFTHQGPDHDDGTLVARGLQEIERLSRQRGVSAYYLSDHAIPFERMVQFASGLLGRGIRCTWDAMARFDPACTREGARLLAASGCRDLQVGLETTDPIALRRFRKGLSLDDCVEEYLATASDAGIRILVFLMTFPGQTRESLERDIEWVLAHAQSIDRATLQPFRLARGSYAFLHPEEAGIEVVGDVSRDLDVEDVPYRTEVIVPAEEVLEMDARLRAELARRKGYHRSEWPFMEATGFAGAEVARALEGCLGPALRTEGACVGSLRITVLAVEREQVTLGVHLGGQGVARVHVRFRDDGKDAFLRTSRFDLYYRDDPGPGVEALWAAIRALAERLDRPLPDP